MVLFIFMVSQFLTQDAFIVDTGCDVIVWVGNNASSAEKKSGLQYAHVSIAAACSNSACSVSNTYYGTC